jgi:UDP-N-acetylmuramate: L-alanyl-gamma-D-glutamyl-meso-diaminopimelate ligase
MAGVALLARAAGHRVTGSDQGLYPPMSTQLAEAGIEVRDGYRPEHLQPAPDVVVIGNALSRGNPAVEYVLDNGLPYVSGPQWLAENVLAGRWVLAVAGTHGKTTVAGMLAWLLEDAGLAPGFLIGGIPGNFGVSARLGKSDLFVVEADEYDTAFFDKRAKFVHYRPRTLILNNLEFDHADIFDDLEAIKRQFHHLVRTVPGNGRILVDARDEALRDVLDRGCWSEVETLGDPGGWSTVPDPEQAPGGNAPARSAAFPPGSPAGGFSVRWRGETLAHTRCPLPGAHNRDNALAAIAAASHVGVTPEKSAAALPRFAGIKRRMELRGEVGGVSVYDDFAHHPTAIAATLAAARADTGRTIAVLDLRSNTMRLGVHREALAGSLGAADVSIVYRAPGVDWDVAAALAPLGERAKVATDIDEAAAAAIAAAAPGDRILVMSNGGFGGIHDKLLHGLAEDEKFTRSNP